MSMAITSRRLASRERARRRPASPSARLALTSTASPGCDEAVDASRPPRRRRPRVRTSDPSEPARRRAISRAAAPDADDDVDARARAPGRRPPRAPRRRASPSSRMSPSTAMRRPATSSCASARNAASIDAGFALYASLSTTTPSVGLDELHPPARPRRVLRAAPRSSSDGDAERVGARRPPPSPR